MDNMQMTEIKDTLQLLMNAHPSVQGNQNKLARLINESHGKEVIKQPTIHRILIGESKDPKTKNLKLLADFFGCTVSQLRGEQPIKPELISQLKHYSTNLDEIIEDSHTGYSPMNIKVANALAQLIKTDAKELWNTLSVKDAAEYLRTTYNALAKAAAKDDGYEDTKVSKKVEI